MNNQTINTSPRLRHLKIKIVSLGMEQTYIRQNENQVRRQEYWLKDKNLPGIDTARSERTSLREHRQHLRMLVRSAQLAYGYLRGKSYREMEPHTTTPVNWKKVEENVRTFGTPQQLTDYAVWQEASQQDYYRITRSTTQEQQARALIRKEQHDSRRNAREHSQIPQMG